MPYTKSKAGIGLGTTLAVNTGTDAEPTWTPVAELKSINQSGRQVATEDVTNFQSSAREFIPTLLDAGSWDIAGSRIATDAGQLAMETAFQGLTIKDFQIQLPKAGGQTTAGDMFEFSALIQELNYSIADDKAVTFSAKLKVSGNIVLTPGS
jgi:predicted secreted protein